MPTRFFTTPEPPMMLIPAASDQATSTIYTGTRTTRGMLNALSNAAIESGNIV
jgi:hypothetical protein